MNRMNFAVGGALLLSVLFANSKVAADEYGSDSLRGAGSTFVYPLMKAWLKQYKSDPYGVIGSSAVNAGLNDALSSEALDYEAVGSMAGVQRIQSGTVEFAASEIPLGADYLQKTKLLQFPMVMGGVSIVATVKVSGDTKPLQLTGALIADIYMGKIKKWSDPAIVAINPDRQLPNSPIHVLHRVDGSGTTYTFSSFLSHKSVEWKQQLGTAATLKWPVGENVKGNKGMAQALKTTSNAIGYLDYRSAQDHALQSAAIQNAAGQFIRPEPLGFVSAAQEAQWDVNQGFNQILVDSAGVSSYPIVATVFGIMKNPIKADRQKRTAAFIVWAITKGAVVSSQYGYVPLPNLVSTKVVDVLSNK